MQRLVGWLEQTKSDSVVGITIEGDEVLSRDLEHSLDETRTWLAHSLGTGECTKEFELQLAKSLCRIPQVFGNQELLVDFHCVRDQLKLLEGRSAAAVGSTKKAEKFKKSELKGLWHSHWFQAAFLAKNLLEETKRDDGDATLEGAAKLMEEPLPGSNIKKVASIDAYIHSSVMGAYKRRASRQKKSVIGCLTGEWIIYAKSNDRNIYLTLGSHGEGDARIRERCLRTVEQFPELRQHAFISSRDKTSV